MKVCLVPVRMGEKRLTMIDLDLLSFLVGMLLVFGARSLLCRTVRSIDILVPWTLNANDNTVPLPSPQLL